MVKERMDLLELLRKEGMDGDVDFLREALRVLVEGIMDAEVSSRIGAEYGERSPDNEYLGCSHALAKGGAAQSQASRQSKLSTGIDEPPTLRAGGSWDLFGVD